MAESDLVPVQNEKPKPIERWIAEIAYRDYTDRFPGQTLDTILARGGFGQNELIDHLARVADDALEKIDQLRYKDTMRHAKIIHRRAEVERLQAELDQERADNQTTYCAYCGERFQLDDSAAALVSEHIRTCEKHPLQDAMREVRRLEAKIERVRKFLKVYAPDAMYLIDNCDGEAMPVTLDEILTAYRSAMDAQRAEVQARGKAAMDAGCYDMTAIPAWEAARAKADAATLALFDLLHKAAYPEQASE